MTCCCVPQQVEPVSVSPADGDGEQCLADEAEQGADCVGHHQDAQDLQNRHRLLVEVLQVEQSSPEQFLGCDVIGDEVYGECGLRDAVDDTAMEGDAVEQRKHAEADHHHGELPISSDKDSFVDAEQSQNGRDSCVEQDESYAGKRKNPCLFGRQRAQMPLVRRL